MIRPLSDLKSMFTNGKMPDQAAYSDFIDTVGQYLNLGAGTEQFQFLGTPVYQPNHGFLPGQLVYCSGAVSTSTGTTTPVYNLAIASSNRAANVAGMVYQVQDTNNFFLATDGVMSLTQSMLSAFLDPGYYTAPYTLLPGALYYLSDSIAGTARVSQPTTVPNNIITIGTAQTSGDTSVNSAATALFILNTQNLGQAQSSSAAAANLVTLNGNGRTLAVTGNSGGWSSNVGTTKFYVGGDFSVVNGTVGQLSIARFNYNGTNSGRLALDPLGFGAGYGFSGPVAEILPSNTGDVIVGGLFSSYSSVGHATDTNSSANAYRISTANYAPASLGFEKVPYWCNSAIEITAGTSGANYLLTGSAGFASFALFSPTQTAAAPPVWSGVLNAGGIITQLIAIPNTHQFIAVGDFATAPNTAQTATNNIFIGHFTNSSTFVLDYKFTGTITGGQILCAAFDLGYAAGTGYYTEIVSNLLVDPSSTGSPAQAAAVIIGGRFSSINGVPMAGLARLVLPYSTATGHTYTIGSGQLTLDTSTTFPLTAGDAVVSSITRINDAYNPNNGALLVCGDFPNSGTIGTPGAIAMLASGTGVTGSGLTTTGTNYNGTYAYVAQATGTCTVSGGGIQTASVVAGGCYATAPLVTFVAGGSGISSPTGATGTATINSAGAVTAIAVNTPGTGYGSAPTVTLATPFIGAAVNEPALAVIVDSVSMGSGGTGYVLLTGTFTVANGTSRSYLAMFDSAGNLL